ncbi:MAG: hypothetical protein ACPGRH_08660 [Alphaproteobacteria bacterium]
MFRCCILVALLFAGISLPGKDSKASKSVAIMVANRVNSDLNRQIPVFEDSLTALLSDEGFGVISPEIVISAVGDLKNRKNRNKLDSMLDDQTSALRLSQNLGADYILFASIMDFSVEKRKVNAYNVKFINHVYKLQASYRILSGITGESLIAGLAEAHRTIQRNKHSSLSLSNIEGELLTEVAIKLSKDLTLKQSDNRIRAVEIDGSKVEMEIAIALDGITFPEVVINEDGTASVVDRASDVQALGVTVELDGFVIGTTNSNSDVSKFYVTPGLHRMRLMRDDLITWERMINIHDGMQLNVVMNLNKAGHQRWVNNTNMYHDLKVNASLEAAEVEVLRSRGQMLRQSGYKVNLKDVAERNISVDTDEAVQIHNTRSLINSD